MKTRLPLRRWLFAAAHGLLTVLLSGVSCPAEPLSPLALTASRDGATLYIAATTGQRLLVFDTASEKVRSSVTLPAPPLALALSADGSRLYVVCGGVESWVCVVDTAQAKVVDTLRAGHTASAVVPHPDGKRLYVCNRFTDDVSVLDLGTGREGRRIRVQREPVAAAITADGRHLLVANHLHAGAANANHVAAVVSVIDTVAGSVVKELPLPNGSGLLNDIRVSPDGRHAVVTQLLARYPLPTTQLDRGWMNTNAKSIIDLARLEVVNTVLLDNVDRGAANPWGVGWASDGRVVVAHAGTHEISVIDFAGLLAKLDRLPEQLPASAPPDYNAASRVRSDVVNDLSFLVGLRQRLALPEGDFGPRGVAVVGNRVYTANYFSDSLTKFDLDSARRTGVSLPLGPPEVARSVVRLGEFYFHDAGICFQGWQSCASCHPGDARVDALNWDLLNDGIGNPKNNRSLLLTHATPPSMSMGVRDTGEMAVRAGIRHILFTVQAPEVADSIDAYLKDLKPVPSPLLVKGRLSAAARRGKKIFEDRKVGCVQCHPPGLFTDQQPYDVGTLGSFDKPGDQFDTPTLIEGWRTAPYLHDGSAVTMKEVVTTANRDDRHGRTSHLRPDQIDDLVAYLLSL